MTHDTCCPVAGRVLVPELSDKLDRVEAGILGESCCGVEREQSVRRWSVAIIQSSVTS
jgi:hypothetical protein